MSERRSKDGRRPTPSTARSSAPAAPARGTTPLAGLARSAQSASGDVMGGQAVPDDIGDALRRRAGSGTRLPGTVADDLGSKLGADLSGVRVHADAEADTIARSVQAKAFTLGSDIYFTQGSYAPSTSGGRGLLAHELTHVRQHQQGTHRGGGGMSVGRVDDPAEKEAEKVSRQVMSGGDVCQGEGGNHAGHVHRSPLAGPPTVRRLLGIMGLGNVGSTKETKELKTDDEDIPPAFLDLADTIQASTDHANLKNGIDGWNDANSVGNDHGWAGTMGAISAVSGGKQLWDAGKGMKEGIRDLRAAKEEGDSFGSNLGATTIEKASTGLLGGIGSMEGASGSFAKIAGENVPGLDVASNIQDATVKGKKAIEDSVASARLGGQKVKAKREGDQYLPDAVRAQRFGTFATEYAKAKGGKVKSDDKKRWAKVEQAWVAKGNDPASGFAPLTQTWTGPLSAKHLEFLEFLRTDPSAGNKDFGFGTDLRKAHEQSLVGADGTRTKDTGGYEEFRDLGKVSSFGQRRKGETATVNAVEAVGHAADAAGTFTAGGDLGATKVTGKVIKGASAAYKGIKSLVKRGRRVSKLADAKNAMAYDGKTDRGFGWKVKQFFGGNIEGSQEKSKDALNASVEEHERLTAAGTGPAANASHTVAGKKGAKMMTKEQAAPLTKKLTLQCMRRIDDLLNCLGSSNAQVAARARKIMHVIAETNLAGSIEKLDEQQLTDFGALHAKVRGGTATDAEKTKHDKQKQQLTKIVQNQLSGIGG